MPVTTSLAFSAASGNVPPAVAELSTTTASSSSSSLRMSGLTIDFPFRPYPAQLALMDRLLKAVLNKHHALLESPTGSGKSVALLCSSLAWQAKEKIDAAKRHMEQQQCAPPYQTEAPNVNDEKKSNNKNKSPNPSSSSAPAPKIPKIYFASRTHSQIQQLVSELKSTSYRPTMSVLASRNQYCIHPDVAQSNDKNDSCQKLLDFNECSYNRNVHRLLNRPDLHRGGKHVLWDIEELVALGEKHHSCPYFVSRTIADSNDTDLIFCPYNYLVDPMIAKSMGIDLEGAVVIIDESHNIEDMALNAASRELDLTNLRIASAELQRVLDTFTEGNDKIAHFRLVRDFVEHMIEWMQNVIANMSFPQAASSSSTSSNSFTPTVNLGVKDHTIFTGDECVNLLSSFSITPASLKGWLKSLEKVCAKPQDDGAGGGGDATADKLEPHITGIARATLESFGLVCEFLFSSNMKFVRDYRMVVKKELLQNINNKGNRTNDRSNRDYTYLLCFWCLNPAVAFQRLSSTVRSVILTSGTLSPMNSFASELATSFPIRLEAPHVIDPSQVLAHVVSKGPNGVSLRGTYKSHEDCTYLDELGAIVESIIARTPGGVLLFFPSYSMMDRVVTRWRDTKLYMRLMKHKEIVMEPRASGTKFDFAMEKFTKANERFNESQSGGHPTKQKPAKKSKRTRATSGSNEAGAEPSPEDDESEYGGTQVKFTSTTGDSAASSSSSSSRQLPVFVTKGTAAKSQTGGMFLAVTRGKISEGIDFADFQARAVIVLGVPYPNSQDCKVMLKRAHNDQQKKVSNDQLLTGSDWYSLQAYRTVNQAVGRAIRHKYDYGAIYLVDERYLEPKIQDSLSKWVQTNLNRSGMPFAAIEEEIEKFFGKWTANPPARPASLVSATATGSATLSNANPLAVQKTKMTQFFSTATLPATSNSSNLTAAAAGTSGGSSALPLPIDSDEEYSEVAMKVEAYSKQPEKSRRTKTEIAYESESEEPMIDLTTTAAVPLLAPTVAPASSAISSAAAKSLPVSSDPPSHLGLSCKRCEHALAQLPLVLTTSKPTSYQQTIEQKYFVQTVDAARRRFPSEGVSDEEPVSVSAMVCSTFALERPVDGNFGWIGYPSFTPEGLMMPDSLVKQFYNVWSEEDQICYQPLCCSSCRSFVATQILVDRRDGSLNFEEACWIANDLIRIKPISAASATIITEPIQSAETLLKTGPQEEGKIDDDSMQDANDFHLPLSMPTLESAHEIAQTHMKRSPPTSRHSKRSHASIGSSHPPQSMSLSTISVTPLNDISLSINRTVTNSSSDADPSSRSLTSNPPLKKARRDEIIELDDEDDEQDKISKEIPVKTEAISLRRLLSAPSDDMDDFLEDRANAVHSSNAPSLLTTKPSSKTFTKKHVKRFV